MADQFSTRKALAAAHLNGSGIEIGARHQPLLLPNLTVKYVDIMPRVEMMNLFTHLTDSEKSLLVDVDIIDDGEHLAGGDIADGSLDFIIANHVIEHCANPIRTILNHLKKIKIGGALYYAVPDKNYTFDNPRINTTVLHLIDEYEGRTDPYDINHYIDWTTHVEKLPSSILIHSKSKSIKSEHGSIHFHVWEAHTFIEFISAVQAISGEFIIERFFPNNGNEFVVILRKI